MEKSQMEWPKSGNIQRDIKTGMGYKRRSERARKEIYRGTHPPWSIYVYGKSMETGCIPIMADTPAGESWATRLSRLGGEKSR